MSLKKRKVMKIKKYNRFAKRVYRVIHPEWKLRQYNTTGTVGIYDSGYFTSCLTSLAQGIENYERVGNKVNFKSIKVRVKIEQANGNESNYNQYRLLLVKYRTQQGSGTIDLANIYDFTTSGDTHINAYRNLSWLKAIKVIKDTNAKTLGRVGGLKAVHTWNWYLKTNTVTTYQQDSGDPNDIQMNGFWLLCYADQAANPPNISIDVSSRFIDC